MTNYTKRPAQRQFFRDIHAWIKQGCTQHKTFSPIVWLCYNYKLWCIDNRRKNHWDDGKAPFIALGYKSNINPFNPDTVSMLEESKQGKIYKNPQRLEFINKWK